MKLKRLFFSLFLVLPLISCAQKVKEEPLSFAHSELSIHSGDSVIVTHPSEGIVYSFVGKSLDAVHLDSESGTITYDSSVPSGSQLLYSAKKRGLGEASVVLTLCQEEAPSSVIFENLIPYLTDGDFVSAKASQEEAITYELKEKVAGISLDSSSGRVHFAPLVSDGTEFVVRAKARNGESEKTFVVAKNNLCQASTSLQYLEASSSHSIRYGLDWSKAKETKHEVLGIYTEHGYLSSSLWSYEENENKIRILGDAFKNWSEGNHRLSIVTNRNSVNVKLVLATHFISTPEELANIGKDEKSLRGYYVQTNDIDLTSFCEKGNEGYHDGKGWEPIGHYQDVTDGSALQYVFKGTYDGGGHSIRGLWMNRDDESAYNAGLFGYVGSTALIKNLSLEASSLHLKSFSGALVGSNDGTIVNCSVEVSSLSNFSGENVFRYLGTLVGQNQGAIRTCYSVGHLEGDYAYGAFVGNNLGTIEHCYACYVPSDGKDESSSIRFQGGGVEAIDCSLFLSKEEMIQNGFPAFDPSVWTITKDALPKLKETTIFDALMGLELLLPSTSFTKGEDIPLAVQITPSSYQKRYEDEVIYEVKGEGVSLEKNVIHTSSSSSDTITIQASLHVQGEEAKDQVTVTLKDKTESLSFLPSLPQFLFAGEAMTLKAYAYPSSASQDCVYSLVKSQEGVRLVGNRLETSEMAKKGTIEVVAKQGDIVSNPLSLEIIPLLPLDSSPSENARFQGENQPLHFSLPKENDATKFLVTNEGNDIPFEAKGNEIIVSSSVMEKHPNETVRFKIVSRDTKTQFIALAAALTSSRRTEETIRALHPELHTISSLDDFVRYFNVSDYSESRISSYYGKDATFLLTADLDFSSLPVTSIGTPTHPFLGTIYGNGHVIKNFGVANQGKTETEEKYLLSPSSYQGDWNYRPSLYGVGFFGTFGGKCYDCTFVSSKISANNWVGGFAGNIISNGVVENVHLLDCLVSNANGVAYEKTKNDSVSFFAPGNEGTLRFVCANGNTINLNKGELVYGA